MSRSHSYAQKQPLLERERDKWEGGEVLLSTGGEGAPRNCLQWKIYKLNKKGARPHSDIFFMDVIFPKTYKCIRRTPYKVQLKKNTFEGNLSSRWYNSPTCHLALDAPSTLVLSSTSPSLPLVPPTLQQGLPLGIGMAIKISHYSNNALALSGKQAVSLLQLQLPNWHSRCAQGA